MRCLGKHAFRTGKGRAICLFHFLHFLVGSCWFGSRLCVICSSCSLFPSRLFAPGTGPGAQEHTWLTHCPRGSPKHEARVAAEVWAWACHKWQAIPCYLTPFIRSMFFEKGHFSKHDCTGFCSKPCKVGSPATVILFTQLRTLRLE